MRFFITNGLEIFCQKVPPGKKINFHFKENVMEFLSGRGGGLANIPGGGGGGGLGVIFAFRGDHHTVIHPPPPVLV